MCGILYSKSFNGQYVNKRIARRYRKQKHRGVEGFGFLGVRRSRLDLNISVYEHDILKRLADTRYKEIMFHHRRPTSTQNNVQTNHPILSTLKDYKHNYVLIHNGSISNHLTMFNKHKDIGIKYTTRQGTKNNIPRYNDSETLLHELALSIEGVQGLDEMSACGNIAFVLLQTDKENRAKALYFGRNYGSPLKIEYEPGYALTIASEGKGEDIEVDKLHRYDYKTGELRVVDMRMKLYSGTTNVPHITESKATTIIHTSTPQTLALRNPQPIDTVSGMISQTTQSIVVYKVQNNSLLNLQDVIKLAMNKDELRNALRIMRIRLNQFKKDKEKLAIDDPFGVTYNNICWKVDNNYRNIQLIENFIRTNKITDIIPL